MDAPLSWPSRSGRRDLVLVVFAIPLRSVVAGVVAAAVDDGVRVVRVE